MIFEYGSVEWLGEFRLLMCVGFGATLVLLAILNWPDWRKPKTTPAEHCKLHSRPLGSCPPGSHDA